MPNFIDRLSDRVAALGSWFFLVATVLMWAEVAARYVFASPTVWGQEIVTALVASAFMLGGAVCMRGGQHIRIGFLVDGAGPGLTRLAALLSIAAAMIFLGGLLWGAANQAIESIWSFDETRWTPETTGRAWDVPLPPVMRSVLVLAAALFIAQALVWYLRLLRHPGRDA